MSSETKPAENPSLWVRAKEFARVRLEGERGSGSAERLGARQRRRDHGAVAAVHAVEIADRHHGAAQRVVAGGVVAHHGKRSGRRRVVGHGGPRLSDEGECPGSDVRIPLQRALVRINRIFNGFC